MRELPTYRDHLELLNRAFPNRDLLTMADVKQFTGYKDNRTVKRHFPGWSGGRITKVNLARAMAMDSDGR